MKSILLAAAAALFTSSAADAATVRVTATGTITEVGSSAPAGFAVGQSASLVWEYDTDATSEGSPSNTVGLYSAGTSVSMTFNGQTA